MLKFMCYPLCRINNHNHMTMHIASAEPSTCVHMLDVLNTKPLAALPILCTGTAPFASAPKFHRAVPPSRMACTKVSSANAQRAYVEDLMAPIVAAVTEALAALRAALDVRVYVATGRALWDYVGKDLYEFVEGLSVSGVS